MDKKVKILHLSTQDDGGAGRAALRLHQALLQQGIDSKMLVQRKTSDLSTIQATNHNTFQKACSFFRRILERLPLLLYKKRQKDIFSSTFFMGNKNLIKQIQEINPDIIHLHWINSGFLTPNDLTKLKKPIFWSLHDANPFTGGCHYVAPSCKGVQYQCEKCPQLSSRFKYDLSFFNFKNKQRAYKRTNLTINGLSQWIASEAQKSLLFHDKKIVNLPNTINTKNFRSIDKQQARKLLNLCIQKKILGFGAITGTQIDRKGYPQLKEALEKLQNKEEYILVVFGSSQGDWISGIETHFLGHIYDDLTLAIIYSALDIFIVPSLAENLSNAIMESLSCGTPVVAFDVGGNSDMITHKQNGYLAKDTIDLKNGILWCIQNQLYLSQNARVSIVERFNYDLIAKKYIEEYRRILQNT